MFFWQWWCSDDLNRAINKEEFIDYQAFVYPTDSSEVGTSKLLRCLEPWAYPFFQSFRWWHWLGKFGRWLFIYSSLSDLVLQGLILLFFFPFRPLKRVHVSTFPPKKDVEKASLQKIVAFAVNSVGVGVPSPSNHRDRDDWVLWRVGPVSHDLPPERRLQPQRGESFMEGERTIVKGSAASWGIKIQTLIFRRGWSMMLDSMFHKQRGRLGENVFFHANQPFPIGPWLPRILCSGRNLATDS